MRPILLALVVLVSGIYCMGCRDPVPERPNTVFELSYLSYRQPNRDPNYPAMVMLIDLGDGHYSELGRGEDTSHAGEAFKWGNRYRVRKTSSYSSYTRHSSSYINEVLEVTPDLDREFRLHSISKPYFAPDGRSFIDGKKLTCGEVCPELDAALAAEERFDLVAGFGDTADEPIRVTSIERPTCYEEFDCYLSQYCCDTDEGFQCVAADTCPEGRSVGISPEKYKRLE